MALGSDREGLFSPAPNWCGGGVSRSHGLFLLRRYILELTTCSSVCLASTQTLTHTQSEA